MENRQIHIAKITLINLCRLLLAVAFIFSGFVKAVDPLGTTYKIQDYLEAFGMASWIPFFFPLVISIALSTLEFVLGVLMLFGISRRMTTLLTLALMCFMTPLTLYLAIANPVSDCGCFGDAWVLTNWETFGKNIVLLLAAIVAFRWQGLIIRFISQKSGWLISLYTIIFIITLSLFCLNNLPILDFRPYKIGTNIKESMSVPPGAKRSVYESVFVLQKDGEKREFTLDNYPDSTWTFVDARTVLREQGYEPPIQDFSMMDIETGEDISSGVLSDDNYTFLLVAHRIEEADDSNIDLINEIYDYAVEHGYSFYALTSSPDYEMEQWRDKTGAEYPFCLVDDTVLKTIIRANPGLLLIKDGTILNKWNSNQLPDEYALTGPLNEIPLGTLAPVSNVKTIGFVLLWFIVPLLFVLGLDVYLVKRGANMRMKRENEDLINPLNKE